MGEITFAVVPSSTPGDSRFALDALCVALTKLLDTPVSGINSASYQVLAGELEKNRVDYAWMSPTLMVLTNEHIQLRPLLSAVRNDRTDYCSALFVDSSLPITSVDELRGCTVAWVDTTSASGYLVPRMQLAARGIDPATFFRKELFLRSHKDVITAVLDGRAEAGATYAEPSAPIDRARRGGFTDIAPHREVRVLEWSAPIPNDVIAAHGLLSKPEQLAFAHAIMQLSEQEQGKRLLRKAFNADKFVIPPRNALRPIQELVDRARAHGLFASL